MLLQENFNKILDYYFSEKKFPTANRIFFENINTLRTNQDNNFAFPWTISWQLTSACNLRCKHCFFAGNEQFYNSSDNLNTANTLNLADELSDLNVVAVSLSGGEILLRPDLIDIIKKLKSKNIAVSLQTNATLLTDGIVKELSSVLNPYVDYVQVSLDGVDKDIFEQIRGAGTFQKVTNGINTLIQNGINVNINSTILNLNQNVLREIYDWANKTGIKKLSLSPFIPEAEVHEKLIPDFVTSINSLAKAIELASEGDTFLEMHYKFYDFVQTEQLRIWTDEYLKDKKKDNEIPEDIICHKHNTLFINANGEVFLCYSCSMKEGLLGKYPDLSMKDIWENRNNNIFFQNRLASKSVCNKCKYFKYCKAGCMGNAFKKYNSIYAKDFLCKYSFSDK